jgi:hypothetical protein
MADQDDLPPIYEPTPEMRAGMLDSLGRPPEPEPYVEQDDDDDEPPLPATIGEWWAYVLTDPDGQEGIPGFLDPVENMMVPMTGVTRDRMDWMRPLAQQVANDTNQPVILRRFSTVEDVDRVEPEPLKPELPAD